MTVSGLRLTVSHRIHGMVRGGFSRRAAAIFVAVAAACCGAILGNSPVAQALPPGFPDIDKFTAVDPALFIHPGAKYPQRSYGDDAAFWTPDGVYCQWGSSAGIEGFRSIRCVGNIPGVPEMVPNHGAPGCTALESKGGSPSGMLVFSHLDLDACANSQRRDWSAVLPVGHKLDAPAITCAVGEGNVTACVDRFLYKGFVLAPSGSWTF